MSTDASVSLYVSIAYAENGLLRAASPPGGAFHYGKLAACGYALDAHVWAQRVGNDDGAVGLLVIFHDGDPCASHRQAGPVQGVHELALSAAFRLEADSRASRLKRFAV